MQKPLDETGWEGWREQQSGRSFSNMHTLLLTQTSACGDMPFKHPRTSYGTMT